MEVIGGQERKSRAQASSGRSNAVPLRAVRYAVAMRVLVVLLLAAAAFAAETMERVAARVVKVEGDTAVIALGREHGIREGIKGSYYTAPQAERKARYGGRATVVAVDARTARLRVEPLEGVAVRAGDWVDVIAAVPDRTRSVLWDLARRGVALRYADDPAPIVTYRGLYAGETPEVAAALMARMAERVEGATADDVRSFLRYRAQEGNALIGATIEIEPALAAWIEAGKPPSDAEILERLLALDDKDAAGRAALLREYRAAVERSVARMARFQVGRLARRGDVDGAKRHLAIARDAVALFGLAREAPYTRLAEADVAKAEGDRERELAACEGAAELFARREPPDRFGEARARERAAAACAVLNRLDAAYEHYSKALALHRATKNASGAANCVEWRGRIHAERKEWPLARADLVAAVAGWRETKNKVRLADALSLLGLVAENTGDEAEALRHYEEAAGLLRAGRNSRGEAFMLAEIGRLHMRAKRYADAVTAYDRAIELLQDPGELAYCLRQRGLSRQRLGRTADALADLARAVALRRELGDRGQLADTLIYEGNGLLEALRIDEAGERGREALALATDLTDRGLEARARFLVGSVALARARYEDAANDLERSRDLFTELEAPAEAARATVSLGTTREMRGDFDGARACYRAARETAPAETGIRLLALTGDIRVLVVRGDLDEAQTLYDEARKLPDEVAWNRVSLLAAGAEMFAERGENEKAFAAFDEAITLCSELKFDQGAAFTLAKRGHEWARQGDTDGAMQDYERAMNLHPNPEVAAEVARGCAEVLLSVGNFASAVTVARKGVDSAREQKSPPLLARNLLVLAGTMAADGRPAAEIEPVLAEAERTGREIDAPLVRAEALRLRGLTLAEPAAAERNYREALALVADQPARQLAWQLHFDLSVALAAQGDAAAAADEGRVAVKILEEMRGALGGGAAARRRFVADRIGVYESLAELLGQLIEDAKDDAAKRQALIDEAMELVARARFERLAGDVGGTGSKRLDDLLENYRQAQRDVARQRKAQVEALARGNGERAKALGVVLANTEQRLSDIYAKVKAQDADLGARLHFDPRRVGKAMRKLPAGPTLVVYFPGETKLFLWVFTHEGFKEWRQVDIGRAHLYALVKEYRDGIDEAAEQIGNKARPGHGFGHAAETDASNPTWYRDNITAMRPVLRELHDRLLAPISRYVAAAEPLLVLPYGQLSYLPFEALLTPDDEFVGATKRIAYFTSEDHLDDVLRSLPDEPRRGRDVWVAFANPRGNLGSALDEAGSIGALFGTAEVHTHESGTAGEEHVLGLRGDCSILHFATHGVLNADDPGSSYLQLDERSGDGKLEQREIWPRLEHQAGPFKRGNVRLVVLAACETARGATNPQAEVLGMPDAFALVGTPAVVASLWSVYTYTTTDLMIEFYKRVTAGTDTAGALLESRHALMTRKQGRYAHPFYWAPFLLFGDWR
jgi:tetratricopeptide (TPR) repeat protein